jgi:hypothetical protein
MKELRIAAALPAGRSRSWKVKRSRGRRDLIVSREGAGEYAHVSLHGLEDWHIALEGRTGRDRYRDLPVAPEVCPGIRHAVAVIIGKSASVADGPPPPNVQMIEPGPEPDSCVVMDVFLADPEAVTINPAGGLGEWTIEMANRARAYVFACRRRFESFDLEIDAPTEALHDLRKSLSEGSVDHLMVFGPNERPLTIVDAALNPA